MSRNALIRCMYSDLSKGHKLFPLLSRCLHHHFWHSNTFFIWPVWRNSMPFCHVWVAWILNFKRSYWSNVDDTIFSEQSDLFEQVWGRIAVIQFPTQTAVLMKKAIILLQPWIWLQANSSFSSQASWSFIILISVSLHSTSPIDIAASSSFSFFSLHFVFLWFPLNFLWW